MGLSPADLAAIREIFFLSSSRQSFTSEEERDKFFETWTGFYFKNCPELILVDRDDSGHVRGYLMGADDSAKASAYYSTCLKSYSLFEDLFESYPAHFHINVHPSGRSQGVGARLIARFVEILRSRKVPGLHLVTSPDAANVNFYRRNGFLFEVTRPMGAHSLLFMAKKC